MENIGVIALLASVIILAVIVLYFIPVALWFSAKMAGVRIKMIELVAMQIRRVPVKDVVLGLIASSRGGLVLTRIDLETVALSGGNVQNIVNGMIAAKRAEIPLSLKNAVKADAQGLDIVNSVKNKLREAENVKFE